MAAAGNERRCVRAAVAVLLLVAASVPTAAAAEDGFITWDDLSIPGAAAVAAPRGVSDGAAGGRGGVKARARARHDLETIVVSQDGTGHSRTVQGAVDMVPAGNPRRVKILVRPGVYRCVG
jgi:pectinesterase